MKKTVYVECAAIAARRQRLQDFQLFIKSSLKTKSCREILAMYSLKTGLSKRTVDGYLRLMLDSRMYKLRAGKLEVQ